MVKLNWLSPMAAVAGEPSPSKGAGGQNPPPMTDIHDIKPLVNVVQSLPWTAILMALLIVAVLAAAFFYWRYLRKSLTVKDIVAELPPEVTANQALDKIAEVEKIDGKTFYYTISAILRIYIFERFALNAPEMTTEELIPQLKKLDLPQILFDGIVRLSHGSDPVKYAGKKPEIRQMEEDLKFARRFIDGTTPKDDETLNDDESPLKNNDDGHTL